MYIELLINIFQETTSDKYPEINSDDFISALKTRIENSKFDLQDQTIIERILKEDADTFSETFLEQLDNLVPEDTESKTFFESEEGKNQVLTLFKKSVEHSIDYFYNDVISKQFSGK